MDERRQVLAGTFALLAATFGLLLAAALGNDGRTSAPASEAARRLDPGRLLELSERRTPAVARRVAAIRELEFREVPRPRLGSVAALRRKARRSLARPAVRRQIRMADVELRLLGMLDEGASVSDVARGTAELAAAYYEPRRGALFVVGDAVPAGRTLAEFVLAHELTHALEDQRFGLPVEGGISDDRALARLALVEGSATAVMMDYAARHLDLLELAADASSLEPATGGLPRFALAEVNFAYLGGAEFVAALRGIRDDWRLVDFAHRTRPPATTEQVLHPEKYLAGERALPTAPPAAPGGGWRRLDAGLLGEFATTQLLREALDAPRARAAAAGWGGDAYALYGAGCGAGGGRCARHALGIAWRWDSPREAKQFAAALREYAAAAPSAASVAVGHDRVVLGVAASPALARRLAR